MTSIDRRDLGSWAADEPAPRRGLRRNRRAVAAGLAKIAGLIGLTALVLALAITLVPSRDTAPPAPAASEASWIDIIHPMPIYGLSGTDFVRLPQTYQARRRSADRGRQDVIGYGDTHTDTPFLALSFDRLGSAVVLQPFAGDVDAVARAEGLALTKAETPSIIASRFGLFEAADIRVERGAGEASCLGFRSAPGSGSILRIAGLLCGGADRPAARDGLGCVIDRIDLLGGADDLALQQLFVEAERRRGKSCAPSPLTAAGSRVTWLDANASLPVLRGTSLARQ